MQARSFYTGKVILTGEHSVVFGHEAILANLDLGIEVVVMNGNLDEQQKNDSYLQHLLQIFARETSIDVTNVDNVTNIANIALQIDSSLPAKSGLGSSAAFAAAVLSALASFYSVSLDDRQLYQLVVEAENFIHGRSSGADPAIVVYAGLLVFARGQITPFRAPILTEKTFFLINSGQATESTGEMVSLVSQNPQALAITAKIGELSHKMLELLRKNEFLPELLNENQALLEQLGVVSQQAKNLVNALQNSGAFCKITGAGGIKTGSGYILAYHDQPDQFEQLLAEKKLHFFKTHLGVGKIAKGTGKRKETPAR